MERKEECGIAYLSTHKYYQKAGIKHKKQPGLILPDWFSSWQNFLQFRKEISIDLIFNLLGGVAIDYLPVGENRRIM